ncbi:MAG: S41 family peptidase [Ruminococcus sp.]|nr:S41 family peptidase [Ruminococcus sp.]
MGNYKEHDNSTSLQNTQNIEEDTKKFQLKTSRHEVASSIVLLVCGAILTIMVLNIYSMASYGKSMFSLDSTLKDLKSFFQAETFVESSFYTDYDEEKLLDGAISGYISSLDDKYSRYESSEEYNKAQIKDAGQSIGIGITVKLLDDGYIEVQEVNENTPAEEAGIQVGDIIKSIDGKDVVETGYEESISLIKDGEDNTTVDIEILRDDETLDISVTRTVIDVDTAVGKMLDNSIGYIQITHFYTNTSEQFNSVYQELLDQGAKAFIFDLRNNTGGYTTSVQGCLNDLVPKGDIAEATYKDGTTKTIIKSDSDNTITVPSVVLINGMTASAGEIFSSAMRELEGSILVGENTYGKGVMQVTQPLSNGGAVVLTVATYNIVGKECYHGVGLAPDYEVTLTEEDTEDTQLDKAIEVIDSLIVNS